jgi:hypothetical protein
MRHQHLSQTQNTLVPSQSQTQIAQHSTHPVEELQSAIGNRAVNQLLVYAEKLGSPKLLTREYAINHHQR